MTPFFAQIATQQPHFDCIKHPIILQLENLNFSTFHVISLTFFILAILHTFSVSIIHKWAKRVEREKGHTFFVHMLLFCSEVEVVFALWAIPLFVTIFLFYGWNVTLQYFHTRDYTEALFVVVILAIASTRPILHAARTLIQWIAKRLGNTLSAWWLTLLTIGPLLGSLITEAGAMALCALLLSTHFFHFKPSSKLAYATIALLFVNISVGGILTDFASPAVLVLAHCWGWTILKMLTDFGWKAVLGIVLSNAIYWLYFKKELKAINVQSHARRIIASHEKQEPPIPVWVTVVHMLFMAWVVVVGHYPALFIASFLFFIAFHQATREYQAPLKLQRPLMVGLFLAGLLIHGNLQGWWVVRMLDGLSPLSVMGVAIGLTAFNDNTGISYLATLIPSWGTIFEYAVFTGIIAGGGLTVIANAPNPAGYAILKKHFPNGIQPLKLFVAALIPTLVLYLIFYFFGPVFTS